MEGLQSAFSQPRVLHEGLSLARILKDVYIKNLRCQKLPQTSGNPAYAWCSGTLRALSSTIRSHCKRQFCRTHDAFMHFHVEARILQLHTSLITWSPSILALCLHKVNYVTFLLYNAEEETPNIKNEEICEITKWFNLKNQI